MTSPSHSAVAPAVASAPPVRRTQEQRSDESEQRLLIAAATLIEREGFAAVTFERVGALAGYSRGLAAHKFGSKDGLVRAVIGFVTARVQQQVDARLAGFANPVDRLLNWTDVMLAEVAADPLLRAYFVMMAAAVGNRADIRTEFLAAHEGVRAELRSMIEEGQAAAAIAPTVDADKLALAIGSLHLGISVELLLDPDLDMDALRRSVRDSIGRMLTP